MFCILNFLSLNILKVCHKENKLFEAYKIPLLKEICICIHGTQNASDVCTVFYEKGISSKMNIDLVRYK